MAVILAWSAASPAFGYLGSFETADGYASFPAPSPFTANLLDHYNAGQFPGNPDPAAIAITPGTGLWTELAPTTSGYAVSGPDGFHSGIWSLDLRGGTLGQGFSPRIPANAVDLEYRYRLDAKDLGGISPTAGFNNTEVTVSFYYCGGVGFQGDDPGVFRMKFQDQFGTTGAGFGLDEGSALTTLGASGWVSSPQLVGPNNSYPWTYVRVTMDFANDVFSVGITPNILANVFVADSTPTALFLVNNAPMAFNLVNLSQFEFWVDSEVGIPGSTGVFGSNKQLLDDFRMSSRAAHIVPETNAASVAVVTL
ncbi:MAG: hypothetical protein ACKVYV_10075, partial [Limisphaerales bacterium]